MDEAGTAGASPQIAEAASEVSQTRLGAVLTRAGMLAWASVGILALLWALLWILGRANVLLAPVVLGVALIYILNPLVNRFARMRIPRVIGAALAFLLVIGALILIGFLVVPMVSDQAQAFTDNFPQIFDDTVDEIEMLLDRFGFNTELWDYERFQEFLSDPENQDALVSIIWERVGAVTSGILEAILVFFVAPVVAFYVLIDLPRLRRDMVDLLPDTSRDEIVFVSGQLGHAIGGFLRGQVLVAFIVGVMMSVGFLIIGLDFWLIIGMVAGALNIVPFVGPWVGGFLGSVVGLVTADIQTALFAALVAVIVQQIDNNFVSPAVLRATVKLHPAGVVLVLILGGAIGGLWGVLLAVPVVAALKIVSGHLWRTRVLGQSWDEASQALLEETEPSLVKLRREAAELEAAARAAADEAAAAKAAVIEAEAEESGAEPGDTSGDEPPDEAAGD